jgi:hypothetical protein
MRRTASQSAKYGCSRSQLVFRLILLLLRANWTLSKILDEETGECVFIKCSYRLFLKSAKIGFKFNFERQLIQVLRSL